MRLSSVKADLASLYLLLTHGLSVSQGSSPEIIGPNPVRIKANPGEMLILHCDAFTNSEVGVTLTYWLINGVFPDEIPSCDRIVESQESTFEDGAILQRSLLLKNVTSQDLKSNFICVVTNASGMAKKHVKLSGARNANKPRKRRCKP